MVLFALVAIWTAPAIDADAKADPIVGKWERMKQFGTFEDVRTFNADGSLHIRMLGSDAKGTWTRSGDRYRFEPSGEDDYIVLKDGYLETHDRDGLIARYRRVR